MIAKQMTIDGRHRHIGEVAEKVFAHARCSLCGVRVAADATECPYCGATFEG